MRPACRVHQRARETLLAQPHYSHGMGSYEQLLYDNGCAAISLSPASALGCEAVGNVGASAPRATSAAATALTTVVGSPPTPGVAVATAATITDGAWLLGPSFESLSAATAALEPMTVAVARGCTATALSMMDAAACLRMLMWLLVLSFTNESRAAAEAASRWPCPHGSKR